MEARTGQEGPPPWVDKAGHILARIVGLAAIFCGGGYAFTDDVGRAIGFTVFGILILSRALLDDLGRDAPTKGRGDPGR